MAFDAALAIRIGSASLFVFLGLAVALVGRRHARVVVLGLFFGLFGLQIMTNNLARAYEWDLFVARGIQAIVTAGAGVWAAFCLPSSVVKKPALAAWWGLAIAGATVSFGLANDLNGFDVLLGFGRASPRLLPFLHVSAFGLLVGAIAFVAAASTAVAVAPPHTRQHWHRAAALAASVGLWVVFQMPTLAQTPASAWTLASTLTVVAGMSVPWLVAAVRTGSRFAARMALVWPAIGAASYLYLLVPSSAAGNIYDPWGLIGVARLVGWSALVWAILRADLLGVRLPHVVVHRGVVAAGALASLFIVAQVAQNFFSAQFGLYMGGIVAGTFVFAASPLQRVFERMGSREPRGPGGAAAPGATAKAGKQQEDAFRGAVRLAWKDRRFDQSEELALAVLADSIGLSAARATAIRHEVEREKGVR